MPSTDRDSAPWWEALGHHRLQVQACTGCGALRWPPRALCNRCWSLEWGWVGVAGGATVASWIVNRHQFAPTPASPYTVVLGRLDDQEDILIPGAWGGRADGSDLAVGMALTVAFEDAPGGDPAAPTVIRWEAAGLEG